MVRVDAVNGVGLNGLASAVVARYWQSEKIGTEECMKSARGTASITTALLLSELALRRLTVMMNTLALSGSRMTGSMTLKTIGAVVCAKHLLVR